MVIQANHMVRGTDIRNEYIRRASIVLKELHTLWDGKEFQPVAFTWVSEEVRDDDGNIVDDIIGCNLPQDRSKHFNIMLDMVIRTKACAILVIRKEDSEVLAIFEDNVGSRSWVFQIEDRGNTQIIGRHRNRVNEDYVGILCNRHMGVS
jgi:hypothetical protein